MFATLRDFLTTLDRSRELRRITVPVSPILEVSEIAERVSRSGCAHVSEHARVFDPMHCEYGGEALLFTNIEGSDFPLAINTFGSYRRMELALGVEGARGGFPSIADRVGSLAKPQPPGSLRDMMSKAGELLPLLKVPPKRRKRGVCQEIVRLTSRGEVDLMRLPLIKCWPFDGDPRRVGIDFSPEDARTPGGDGRYVTFAGMHTIHADDVDSPKPQSHNIGMYRAQLLDETHLAMHWHVHHDGAAHWRSWKRAGKPMPIAICLGGESVLPYAATAPLPPGLSELLMAGFLNGRGIPLVRGKTVPLWVPANSEIVIEGWVSTECGEIGWHPDSAEPLGDGAVFEGPFGDHTGYYSMPDRYPIMQVSAITHRRDAIYPTTIVGYPPQEDYYLGKATERIFLPLLQTLIPDIVDYHLPLFGCFHNCAFVQIDKQYPLQARRVMHAIWGAGQMAWTKCIVIVDDSIDVHDERAVLESMFRNCQFGRDIELVNGPLDILDHAAPRLGAGHKMGFDATIAWPGEEVNGIASDVPIAFHDDPRALEQRLRETLGSDVMDLIVPAFGGRRCVLARIAPDRRGPEAIEAIWSVVDRIGERGIAEFVIVIDDRSTPRDIDRVFFCWLANCDPGRDMIRSETGEHACRIAFDAASKTPGERRNGQPVREWPPIIEMDSATKRTVAQRWREYGFAG